jgi:hypothetical protein
MSAGRSTLSSLELANFRIPLSVNTFAFNLFYRLSSFYVHLSPEQRTWITSNIEIKFGANNRLQWFLDGWKERGVSPLRDVMPSVKIICMRVDKVSAMPEMTEDEEDQIEEYMDTITKVARRRRCK